MQRLETLLFGKKEDFLTWNIAFLWIWFPSISFNTSCIKTLTFFKPALILAIKLAMSKPPFKRNPYLRDKIGLTDFPLKSRFYCIFSSTTASWSWFWWFSSATSSSLSTTSPGSPSPKWGLCPRWCSHTGPTWGRPKGPQVWTPTQFWQSLRCPCTSQANPSEDHFSLLSRSPQLYIGQKTRESLEGMEKIVLSNVGSIRKNQ